MERYLLKPEHPNFGIPPIMKINELVLSVPRGLTLPPGISMDEFIIDMLAGIWIARYPSSASSRFKAYRLGGSRFEARVRRRQALHTDVWLSEVVAVGSASSMPRRADRIAPQTVSVEENYREIGFDMEELLAEAERWRLAYRATSTSPLPAKLKRSVYLEYGRFERLLEVIEQRPEPAERTIAGKVVSIEDTADMWGTVVIEAERNTDLADFDRRRVAVTAPHGETVNTSVQRVKAGRLALRESPHWSPKVGTEVTVDLVKPFGMRQNVQALRNFLNGELEGSWEDLARLLCRPGSLSASGSDTPPPRFFCDEDPDAVVLNDEQRRAVTGAVSTAHAFAVQGPPGTGKTEVICEIIRQLTDRNERVLLLAPSHVAVDEVLSRIGRKPGVRPLRITWNDDRVNESVRDFLESNVGAELAGKIVKPDRGSHDARWNHELDQVEERIRDSQRAKTAIGDRRRQERLVAHAQMALAAANDRYDLARARAEHDSIALREAVSAAQLQLDEAKGALEHAVQRHSAVLALAEPVLSPLPPLAHKWLSAARAQAKATPILESAEAAFQIALYRLRTQMQSAKIEVANATAGLSSSQQTLLIHEDELVRATRAFESASAHQSGFGRMLSAVNLGKVTAAQRYLDQAQANAATWRATTARAADRRAQADARLAALETSLTEAAYAAQRRAEHAREQVREANAQADRSWADLAAAGARVGLSAADDHPVRRQTAVFLVKTVPPLLAETIPAVVESFSTMVPNPANPLIDQLAEAVGELLARRRRYRDAASEHEWCRRELELGESRNNKSVADATAERTAAKQRYASVNGRLDDLNNTLAGRSENPADYDEAIRRLVRRRHVLRQLPSLHRRWSELTADQSDDVLVADVQESLVRASNLVCATTKGIVGRGSDVVRYADYDTLIVDEASRVTESEFLIGANRARRWILVGDEHQLPPHVDQRDEHFLHALTALYRFHRDAGESIEAAVQHLANIWAEDEELHKFRAQSVLAVAEELNGNGTWANTFRESFAAAYERVATKGGHDDPDRQVLTAMLRHLVQSLFQRVVPQLPRQLKQALVWQRRMIEPLARIVDQPVYAGRYRTPPAADLKRIGVTPLVLAETLITPVTFFDTGLYEDAGDRPDNHGFVNEREQQVIESLCRLYSEGLGRSGADPVTVSVLAFYRAQARQLEQRLRPLNLPYLRWEVIDVIDRIQGQQSDLVIISFTRARVRGGIGPLYGQWLQDIRRLNVAFTRARRAVVFVGHYRTLSSLGAPREGADPGPACLFYENLFRLVEDDEHFMRIRRI